MGHAAIEVALLAPWIFLLFAAVLDFGFYAYAAISVQNAARVAALRISADSTAAASSALARTYVCNELATLPNVGTGCPGSTTSGPVQVVARYLSGTGPDGKDAAQVSVTYTTVQLFPLPFLTGKWTFTRIAEAKI